MYCKPSIKHTLPAIVSNQPRSTVTQHVFHYNLRSPNHASVMCETFFSGYDVSEMQGFPLPSPIDISFGSFQLVTVARDANHIAL